MIPSQITAGVTLSIPITLTEYPAGTWSMSLVLRGPGVIDLAASADGETHVLSADAGTTAGWAAGVYWYSLRVTDGANQIHELETGQVEIRADLAAVDGTYDGRGHVERVLDAIEAVIEGRASIDQERYRINNRELQRTPIDQLLKLRSEYRRELQRLKAARKGRSVLGRQVLTRF